MKLAKVILSFSALGCLIWIAAAPPDEGNIFATLRPDRSALHDSGHDRLTDDIDRFVADQEPGEAKDEFVGLGITSHHLPTALPLIGGFFQHLVNGSGPRGTFVILAPDHLEKCPPEGVITRQDYRTPYGILEIDQELAAAFAAGGFREDGGCFEGDHSVGTPAVMIKKFFPEARILPVVLSSSAGPESEERIFRILEGRKDELFVLASVDFSHHHTSLEADKIDGETQRIVERLDGGGLNLDRVDSPSAVRIVLALARKNSLRPRVIDRSNTFRYTGVDRDVTGYLSVVFVPAAE